MLAIDKILLPVDFSEASADATQQARADVLVIGRSPSAGLAGRLRTNVYALIRESPCPVVSV